MYTCFLWVTYWGPACYLSTGTSAHMQMEQVSKDYRHHIHQPHQWKSHLSLLVIIHLSASEIFRRNQFGRGHDLDWAGAVKDQHITMWRGDGEVVRCSSEGFIHFHSRASVWADGRWRDTAVHASLLITLSLWMRCEDTAVQWKTSTATLTSEMVYLNKEPKTCSGCAGQWTLCVCNRKVWEERERSERGGGGHHSVDFLETCLVCAH